MWPTGVKRRRSEGEGGAGDKKRFVLGTGEQSLTHSLRSLLRSMMQLWGEIEEAADEDGGPLGQFWADGEILKKRRTLSIRSTLRNRVNVRACVTAGFVLLHSTTL